MKLDAERIQQLLLAAIANPRWFGGDAQFALRRAERVQRALWPQCPGGYVGIDAEIPGSNQLRALPLQFAGRYFGTWLAPVDDPYDVANALVAALSIAFALKPEGLYVMPQQRTRRFMHTLNNHLNAISMQVDVAVALIARARVPDAAAYLGQAITECDHAGREVHAFAMRLHRTSRD